MTDFHFLRPAWLLAFLPLAVLLWDWARRRQGPGDWAAYVDPALQLHVLIGTPSPSSRLPLWLAGVAGTLAILALAGPAWERLPTPVFRNLSPLVVVMDLSWAMEATDLRPSRLERARYKIDDLLRARKDGQVALVAYAGDAFTVTPLTDDAATVSAQLAALSPRIMPVQGERLELGLDAAARLLAQAGQARGDVLVVTAGESVMAARETAARLRRQGYRVSLLGVGSRDGAPVPLPDGGFLKDREGRVRVSRLDIKVLWDVAQAGGGVYRTLDAAAADTDALLAFIDRRAAAEQQAGQPVRLDQWRDAGIWLLPPLVLLAALGFRRGWLSLLLLGLLLPLPPAADALEWRDLWLRADQQAQRALAAGDAKAAAERFDDPAWKAAAEYRAGDFASSARRLEALDQPRAHYNRGNALARQGQWAQALEAYDRALAAAPDDEDARFNRQRVEEALHRQQQQEQERQAQQDSASSQGHQASGSPPQPGQDGQPASAQNPSAGETSDEALQSQGAQADTSADRSGEVAAPGDASRSTGAAADTPSPDAGGREPVGQAGAPSEPHDAEASPGQPQAAAEPSAETASRGAATSAAMPSEQDQADAQWLRRIPDDPGGLLQRKFHYQYRLRQQTQPSQ
ncbi:VWA domain-containing protein [Methyloparacoccus murrellii]